MSFDDVKKACETWIKNQPQYQLLDVDETAGKLLLLLADKSFYCITPEYNNGHWMVWSDNDAVISELNPVMEYLESCTKRSIGDVLNKVDATLNKSGAAAKQDEAFESGDEGEEEEDDDDYGDECDDGYYVEDDDDALKDEATKPPESDEEDSADRFFMGDGDPKAVTRILKDLKEMKKSNGKFGVEGAPRGDNLFIWDIKLTKFDEKTQLGKDIQAWAKKCNREPVVYTEMKFPKEYPMAPPFVRVIRPRFKFLTGHVTIGGSVCMEMLTKSGWVPTNDIESIMVQIRSEIMSDPNTRLDSNPDRAYDEAEAKQAFERMVARYGWNK